MLVSKDKILFYLKQFKNLNFREAISVLRMAKLRRIKANDIFIKEGSTEQRLAYIKDGLVRAYCLKEDGEECTLLLRWEDQFIASHDNLIFNQPSRFVYQALEDTTLIEIDYNIIKKLVNGKPEIADLHISFLMSMLGDSLDRVESFVLLNAEQRYLKLLREKSNIYNRVADKHIATLLGITPVSLSRIRKRVGKSS